MMFDGAGMVTALATDAGGSQALTQSFSPDVAVIGPHSLIGNDPLHFAPGLLDFEATSSSIAESAGEVSANADWQNVGEQQGETIAYLAERSDVSGDSPLRELAWNGDADADDRNAYRSASTADLLPLALRPSRLALDAAGIGILSGGDELPKIFRHDGEVVDLLGETLPSPLSERQSENDFIFIDTSIENYQELVGTWEDRGTIVLIDAAQDGVDQVLAAMAGAEDVGAIHIVSHGERGVFWLGSTRVDSDALTGELASSFAWIGSKLTDGGDVLLYGCDTGAGDAGQILLDELAAITGADMAASIDDTGAISRGGDWVLENRLGSVETASLVAESWEGLLAPTAISAPADSLTVRDANGAILAQGSAGFAAFGRFSPEVPAGGVATWANVGTVNGQSISISATVVSLGDGDTIRFERPGVVSDDPTIALFAGGLATENATVQIRWDVFYTATGAPAQIDISYTVADIDGVGNLPRSREFVTVDTDTLSSFQASNGSRVLFDTSIPGEVTASGTSNENGEVPSAARFNWLDTSSWTITYNLVPTVSANAIFSHDGDLDFDLGAGGTTVSIPRLDLDANNSTAADSGYRGTYVENSAGVSIVDTDVSVTNPQGNVQSARIVLTNAQAGDALLVGGSAAASGTLAGGISYTRTANEVTLTGASTAAQYQNALRAITFVTAGEQPIETDRSIDINFANASFSSNIATSTISVVEVNDPPVAVDDPQRTTGEDTPLANIAVLGNDTDAEGDPLTVIGASATNGTVTINGDGTLNYTPRADFNGTDTITYTISDGRGGTSSAIVPITVTPVNDAPVATQSLPNQVHTDAAADISVQTAGGFDDVDDTALTYSATSLPAGLSIDPSTGAITGTIDNSASQGGAGGVYSVTVTATDAGGLSASQTFSWTVTNPAPVAADDTANTNEDVSTTIDVLANDADPDVDTLSVISASAANGSVVINADGTITYTPNADFNGPDTITYTVSDGEGGTSTATVSVAVDPVNDAPVAVGSLPSQSDADATAGVNVDVSGGFADRDDATLSYSATGMPAGLSIDAATGVITGTIDNSASQGGTGGVYAVTVVATDAEGLSAEQTFSWNVTNPAPVAADDTASTNEDTPVLIDVLPNDTDPDGDALNVVSAIASIGQATLVGNRINYVPPANFNGTATITYSISDGEGGTSTARVAVTVNPVNDAPTSAPIPAEEVADGETVSVSVADAFQDVDGDALSYSATGLPPGLVIDPATGLISGTIASDASQTDDGIYTAVITVADGNGGAASETITFNIANPPPIATDDNAATQEDTPVNIDVLANDNDPDGDPLTVVSANAPNGTVVIEADGTLTYTPNLNFNGTDTITYEISDGNGGTSIATVTVSIADVNDVPVQSGTVGDQSNLDGQTVSLPVDNAFRDPDGDTLTFSAAGLPVGLTIDPSSGIISGTIDNSASQGGPAGDGVYLITITVSDGRGGTETQSFSWAVANQAPIAANDTATTSEDTPVNNAVLANDVDPDGDDLRVIEAAAGSGTITINADGTLTYVPNSNFNGTDTIVYTVVDDEGGRSSASVDITVTAVNDAPTTEGLPDQRGRDSQVVRIPTASAFTDIDGDDLTFRADGLPPALSIDANTGVISGTLAADSSQRGPFTVTVTATDPSGAEVSATFAYSVQNVPPVAQDDTVSTPEDTPVTVAVLSNDSDPDGDPIAITSASTDNGTVAVNPDGTLTFTPDANFNGEANVTYVISDGQGGTATATLTVNVIPQNDAPTAVDIPDLSYEDGQAVSVTTESFFADIDGDDLTINAIGLPPGLLIDPATGLISGTLASDASQGGPAGNGIYTVTLTADDGNGGTVSQDFLWTITNPAPTAANDTATTDEDTSVDIAILPNDVDPDGDPLQVISASAQNGTVAIQPDGTLTYTPNADFNGPDAITYTISDGNGGRSTAAVTVTVNPINDAPVANDDVATTDEDTPVTIGVLGNDRDVDGDPLTITAATSPDGTVTINPDGTLRFAANADFTGTTTITYEVSDGNGGTATATVNITVNPINDDPVANPDIATTVEDTPVTVALLTNDADVDGDPLTITEATAPNGTISVNGDGSVTYTPDPDFNGTDTITYTVSDGRGGFATSTATITVDPVNDAPVASAIAPQNNDDNTPVALDVSGNFSDIDGDTVTFTATGLPAGLAIDAAGTITGTIASDASQGGPDGDGVYQVTITADDGNGGITSTTFAWTVKNTVPVANNDNATTSEDTPVNIPVLANDTDPDGDALVVSFATAANGTVIVEADGSITYTPDADFNGTDTISYVISDGEGGTSTAMVTVTVDPVNDAPVADPALIDQTNADADTVAVDVSANFDDIDGDVLTFTASGLPTGLAIDASGVISGTIDPAASQGGPAGDGIYDVVITADDGNGGTVQSTFEWAVANPAPVASNDNVATDEDMPMNIVVLANDADPDGDALSIVSASAANGSVTIEANGTLTYTPDANFNGTDTIFYQISDGQGGTDTAIVTVAVNPQNDAPVADPQLTNRTDDDADTVALDVSGNFADVDGDILSYTATGLPAGLAIDAAGIITGTIDPSASQGGPEANGIYTVTVTADDGNGGTASSIFLWTVINPAPAAVQDTASTGEDVPVDIVVLANDADPDGDTLTVINASAANGIVQINDDGTITYTPDANFNGSDTIVYTIDDGEGGSATSSVTVTVNPLNDAPVTAGLPDLTDGNNEAISVALAPAFSDAEGDPLTFTATGLPDGLSIDPTTGQITGTTNPTASSGGPGGDGIYTVTVRATDPVGLFAETTFVWTINNQPPTAIDDSFTGTEDTPQVLNVLDNDIDPDADPDRPITIIDVQATNGTAIVNADGTITFTPDPDFNGTATVTYTIEDANGDPATAIATIEIAPVNDAPRAAVLPDRDNLEGDTVAIDAGALFSDPEGDTLTFSASNLPAGLSIDPATGVVSGTISADAGQIDGGVYQTTITADDGNGGITDVTFVWTIGNPAPTAVNDAASTLEDTPLNIAVLSNDTDPDGDTLTVISASAPNGTVVIEADGSLTYTPDTDFNGSDTITYQVSDGQGGTSTANVAVTVSAENDAPTAQPIPAQTGEDADVVTLDLSAGFADVDADTLTFTAIGLPAGLSINADGIVTGTIDPSASQGGPVGDGAYQVSVIADDGQGGAVSTSFSWRVINPAPTAVDDAAATDEDTPVVIDVLGNDIDPDNDTLTITTASASNGTVTINPDGTITYTPDANFNGTDTVTYRVDDGEGGVSTGIVTVGVAAQNDAPTASPIPARAGQDAEAVNLDVSAAFDDVDGDTLTFNAMGLPAGLTIDGDGTITGTIDPAASQGGPNGDGTYEVTVTADDGNGGTVSTTFSWAVTNPAPVAASDSVATPEDTPVNIPVLGNDSDADGDPLTVTQASAANGTVVIEADGTITYTPDAEFNGIDTIFYTISDGNGGTASASVTVAVNSVNDLPVAADDTATTNEDTPITIPLLANDSDPDGDNLTVTAVTAANGTVTIAADGSVIYTPNADFNGTDTISYTVDDGNGGTDTAFVTVTVLPINDAPVAAPDTATVDEDASVVIPVLNNDVDVDGDPLAITQASSPDGVVTVNADGSVTFTPNADFNGPTTITYSIDDGQGGTATATVSVGVRPVNDPPVAANDTATTDEDMPVTIAPLANDTDTDGDVLSIVSANAPNGTVTINPDGTITYVPLPNFNGTDIITYQVSDGMGGFDTASVTVSVDAVNDLPVAVNDTAVVDEDNEIVIPVLANDADPDGDPLSVVTAEAPNGTVTINGDGTITYVPNPDFVGSDTITYTVSDENGGTSTATVTVTVEDTNETPVDQSETVGVIGGTITDINVLANAFDADGDTLTVISAQADLGEVIINPDGTLRYVAPTGFDGVATITYVISDGNGGTVQSSVFVTVAESGADVTFLLQQGRDVGFLNWGRDDFAPDRTGSFISAPLVILDTVNEFRSLGGTPSLNVDRPLLSMVNGLRSLNGISSFGQGDNPVGEVVRYLDDIRDLRFGIDRTLDPRFGDFMPEALTGFSVRQLDTGSDRVIIESIVRNDVIYVEMRDIGSEDEPRIQEFQLLTRDGSPLPDWISMDARGLAIAERPVDTQTLRLIVRAIDEEGSALEIPVLIQGATGEIQLDTPTESARATAVTLDAMMAQLNSDANDEAADLLSAFK
ncbi:Ig-like domain-containing protein [Erythrobacter litoralis]|uniref:Ig-like domain-containing protein n=1 Tax=Erythrobacter litoralis TaxID=39960 RepID=UPI0024348E01|nr:Ig-like domain-containing protein [Erythrobacter litoralis]